MNETNGNGLPVPHTESGGHRVARVASGRARAGAPTKVAGSIGVYEGEFPHGVGRLLAERQRCGMSFDEAWTPDLTQAAKDAGFTWKSQPGHAESSLSFAKRHFRAAFNDEPTSMYCVVTTCVALQINQYGLCPDHANYEGDDE